MTWYSESIPPVPETTAARVKSAFLTGNLYVDLHAEFGAIYDGDGFADLYSKNRGRRVEVACTSRKPITPGKQHVEVHPRHAARRS